jgi:hypothetical protein
MAIVGAVLLVALAGCLSAALALLRPSAPRTHQVHMTTDTLPRTAVLARQIRAEGAHHHLDILLTAKEYGTLEALEEVDSPSENQFALVIGGVTTRDYPHVRTVTTLAKEHLHVLVKRELADKGIFGLRGKRVALGPPTTACIPRPRCAEFRRPLPHDRNRGRGIQHRSDDARTGGS